MLERLRDSAVAQNLIQNPRFDNDTTGWDLSMYSTWSNRVDHGDSPFSGDIADRDTTTTDTRHSSASPSARKFDL